MGHPEPWVFILMAAMNWTGCVPRTLSACSIPEGTNTENHGVGKWLYPGPQPTVGCLVSGNPVSASSETKVVSVSLRPPYKGGVQSLFVGGVGRQMDNSMKGRLKRGLHGVFSRMKGRQKKQI